MTEKNMQEEDEIIICRCEDLTLAELRAVIEEGYTTIEEIKRKTRLSMGPCRGTTCLHLIDKILAEYKNCSVEDVDMPTNRPPLAGIKLGALAGELNERDC